MLDKTEKVSYTDINIINAMIGNKALTHFQRAAAWCEAVKVGADNPPVADIPKGNE